MFQHILVPVDGSDDSYDYVLSTDPAAVEENLLRERRR